MAHSDEVRAAVRASYVDEMMPLKAAAQKHNVSYNTARNWKDDTWDTARTARRISHGGAEALANAVIDDFIILFNSTISDLKNDTKVSALQKAEAISRLSDAYQKTMKATGASNPKINKYAIAMDVLTKLGQFIRDERPDAAGVFSDILEPFGLYLEQFYV